MCTSLPQRFQRVLLHLRVKQLPGTEHVLGPSWGRCSNDHDLGGLTQTFIFSQFWRPEFQNQGLGRAAFLPDVLGQKFPQFLVAAGLAWPVAPLFHLYLLLSQAPLSLSFKEIRGCIRAYPDNPG